MKSTPCPRCQGTGKLIDPRVEGALWRQRREHLKISLRAVAREMKRSASYVSDLELGKRTWNTNLHAEYAKALKLLGSD